MNFPVNPAAVSSLHSHMRKLLTLVLLTCAATAVAGDLLDRLAADDPRVRETARKELRDVSALELDEMQRNAKDAEAAAALREEVERRREAPVTDRADALARKFASKLGSEKDVLALDTMAIPVLIAWLDRDEEIPNMFFSGSCYVDFTPITLDLAARTWLQQLTGDNAGPTSDDWRRWAAGKRGRPLAELALDGLMRRGYRVRAGTPEESAAGLVAAFEGEAKKGWPTPLNQWAVGGMAFAARWLLEARMGEGVRQRDLFAPRNDEAAPYREWLAANRGFVAWDGRRYTSSAKPEDWLKVLAGDDKDAIAGALRLLAPHAALAAPAARRHLEARPLEVARIMAAAGLKATPEEVPAILAALGSNVLAENYRELLSGDALADFIRTKPAFDLLTNALHALGECGAPRHAALALEFAKSAQNTSGNPVDWVNGRAAQAVAILGDDAQVAKILPWLEASNPFVRVEVACPLLRRGRGEAWPAIAEALKSGHLSPMVLRVRLDAVVTDLPATDDTAAWNRWVEEAGKLRWDADVKRWRR